jgi:hypothetical protein
MRRVPFRSLVFAIACTGCFRISTSEVQVRDPAQATLERPTGEPLLDAGASVAVVDQGQYWYFLSREPYEVVAARAPTGAISLHCEACAAGTTSLALLDDAGRAMPAFSQMVDVGASHVAVSYEGACMLRGRRTCHVPVHARLVVPTSDVVEVRRRAEPLRVWGYLLLGMSVLAVGALSIWAITPGRGDSVGGRAPFAALASVPFVTIGGIGLWHIVTPAEEEVWRPTPAPTL